MIVQTRITDSGLTITAFAEKLGLVSEQVAMFVRKKRPPEPKLLAALGYEREYRYRAALDGRG